MKKNKGITLIALIITIIVLLILAGVSINAIVGDNGVLNQAINAKDKTDEAGEKEKIEFALLGGQELENGEMVLKSEKFKEELNKEFSDKTVTFKEHGNNTFSVSISNGNVTRDYYIDENKNIIRSDNLLVVDNDNDLKEFRDEVNGGDSYENRTIFCSQDISLNIDEEWTPIGNSEENSFKGTFDGKNHSISGIKISDEKNISGLFGINKGIIKNTIISKENNINANADTLAGIVGTNFNKIENCENNANITGKGCVSGICARNDGGIIFGCTNNGEITSSERFCSGISAYNVNNSNNLIENCKNTGNITSGEYWVGGISGGLNGGKISKCYNSGKVVANGEVHYSGTGKMTIVGGITGDISQNGSIEFCYNSGNIYGRWNESGGIAGNISQNCKVSNCYNYGEVTNVVNYEFGSIYGYVYNSDDISNCYYLEGKIGDGEIGSGSADCLIEKTIEEMQKEEFVNELNNGENIFIFDSNHINNGYPILKWQVEK